jgi:hypothetical protein
VEDVAARVGGVGFPELSKSRRIGQDVDHHLELSKILEAHRHRHCAAVAGDNYLLVLTFDQLDHLAEVITNRPQTMCAWGQIVAPPAQSRVCTFHGRACAVWPRLFGQGKSVFVALAFMH